MALLLRRHNISYSNDDLERLVELADGHPFNVNFMVEASKQNTLPVFLADTSELTRWKRGRASEFIQKIEFGPEERAVLAGLKDFRFLDFNTLTEISDSNVQAVGQSLGRLIDFHIVEGVGEVYQISPPLRVAVERDSRFSLVPAARGRMLRIVGDVFRTKNEGDEISVSMVDAAILAKLQEGQEIPEFYSALLLPSHLVWLARRHYDDRQYSDCSRLALSALDEFKRLSPAGKIEACRLLCLASSRLGDDEKFRRGIKILRNGSNDAWARANINFLLGFNERLKGNLPEAEEFLRKAREDSPGNFSAVRELASICMIRGDVASAERFAREAFETAPDNPFILDILLSILIKLPPHRRNEAEAEILTLFETLKEAAKEGGRSFYETRRAEYEASIDNISEACKLIDDAVRKTPGIFHIHALRSEVYLERGNKSVALEEIKNMRRIVYSKAGGERLSNLRSLLEAEASYYCAQRNYDSAKTIYRKKGVFTESETLEAIKRIETEQAFGSH